MNKICTSIEQSKKLIELGLDRDTADMCCHFPEINKTPICVSWNEVCEDEKDVSIPIWSLGALLNLMPKIKAFAPAVVKSVLSDKYCCVYSGLGDNSNQPVTDFYDNPIDAAVDMVIWLLENGYINVEGHCIECE